MRTVRSINDYSIRVNGSAEVACRNLRIRQVALIMPHLPAKLSRNLLYSFEPLLSLFLVAFGKISFRDLYVRVGDQQMDWAQGSSAHGQGVKQRLKGCLVLSQCLNMREHRAS